jgi:valyl-tRNA synthetase
VDTPHPNPSPEGEGLDAAETRAVAGWVLDQILVMLHPFMPFVTEELWHAMGERNYDLIVAQWPEPRAEVDVDATKDVEWLIGLVKEVRAARTELNIPPSLKIRFVFERSERPTEAMITQWYREIERMARFAPGRPDEGRSGATMQIVYEGETFYVPLHGIIDLDVERARIAKATVSASKEAASLAARLANPAFVEKAKPEAVGKARADHAEKAAEVERLQAALARLG